MEMQADSKTVFLGQLSAILTQVQQVLRASSLSSGIIGELKKSVEDILAAVELSRDEHLALRAQVAQAEEGPAGGNENNSSSSSLHEAMRKEGEGISPPRTAATGPGGFEDGAVSSFSSTPSLEISSSSLVPFSTCKDDRGERSESLFCLPPDQGIGPLSVVNLIQWIQKLFMVEPVDVTATLVAPNSGILSFGGGGSSTSSSGVGGSSGGGGSSSTGGHGVHSPGLRLRMLGKHLLQIVQVRCISALREYLHFVTRLTYPSQGRSCLSSTPTTDTPSSPSVLSAVQLARAIFMTSAALKECIIVATSLYQPEVVAAAEQIISAAVIHKTAVFGPHVMGASGCTRSTGVDGSVGDIGGRGSSSDNVSSSVVVVTSRSTSTSNSSTTPSAEASSIAAAWTTWKQARFPLQMAMEVVKEVYKMLKTFSSIMERGEYKLWSISHNTNKGQENKSHNHTSHSDSLADWESDKAYPNPPTDSSSLFLNPQENTIPEYRVEERAEELSHQWGSALAHSLKEIAPSIKPAVEFLASIASPLSESQHLHRMPPPLNSWHASSAPTTPCGSIDADKPSASNVTFSKTNNNTLSMTSSLGMAGDGRRRSVLVGSADSSSSFPSSFTPFGAEATITLLSLSLFPPLFHAISASSSTRSARPPEGMRKKDESLSPSVIYSHKPQEDVVSSTVNSKGRKEMLSEGQGGFVEEELGESRPAPSQIHNPNSTMNANHHPHQQQHHSSGGKVSFILYTQLLLTKLGISFTMDFLAILANFAVHTMEDNNNTTSSATTSGGSSVNANYSIHRNNAKRDSGLISHRIVSESVRDGARTFPILLSYMLAAEKRWRNSIFQYILVKVVSLSTRGGGWPAALVDLRFLTTAVLTQSTGSVTTPSSSGSNVSRTTARTIICSEIGLLYTRCIFRILESPNTSVCVKRELVVHMVQTFLECPSFTSSSPIIDRSQKEISPTSYSSAFTTADASPHIPLLLRLYYSFDLDVHAHSMNVVQQFIALLCRLVRLSPPADLWKEVEHHAQVPRARKAVRLGESNHISGGGGGADQQRQQMGGSSSFQGQEPRTGSAQGTDVHSSGGKKELEPGPSSSVCIPSSPYSPSFLALQGLLMVIDLWHSFQPPESVMEPGAAFFSCVLESRREMSEVENESFLDSISLPSEAYFCKMFSLSAMQELRGKKQKEQYLADVFNRSSAKAIQKMVTLTPEEMNPTGVEEFSKSWEATKLPPLGTVETKAKVEAIADFIWCSPPSSLQPEAVADYITSPNFFALHVCSSLMRRLRLRGLPLIAALEELLLSFALPKEGQRIERLLEYFCDAYFDLNQGPDVDSVHAFPFSDKDACFLVTVATVMLNTSLHNRRAASPMTSKAFCDQLQGANGEKEFPKHYLEEIYQRISERPLRSAFTSGSGTSSFSSSSFAHSPTDSEEMASKVLESLFITAEEKKNVTFGLERQHVMVDVHQSLYARVPPSPAIPVPSLAALGASVSSLPATPWNVGDEASAAAVTTPTAAVSPVSSVSSCVRWWCPLQIARDLFLHSWSSISAVFNPLFYGKVEDAIGLLVMLPTCLRGLQGLLEVATAYAFPSAIESLLQAILRIEKLSSSPALLHPIKEASRWAILNIASSPFGIFFSSSCWKVVFHVMWRARAERMRFTFNEDSRSTSTSGSSAYPSCGTNLEGEGEGKGGNSAEGGRETPPPSAGVGLRDALPVVNDPLTTTTAPAEEEVFARIEGWTLEIERRESDLMEKGSMFVKEADGENAMPVPKPSDRMHAESVEHRRGGGGGGGGGEASGSRTFENNVSLMNRSITSLSTGMWKDATGMENSSDTFSFFGLPSADDGVEKVLRALSSIISEEVMSVLNSLNIAVSGGKAPAETASKAPKGAGGSQGTDAEKMGSARTIRHVFDILERCLISTKIIHEATWTSDGTMSKEKRKGNGTTTRITQSINLDGFHRVVVPSLIASLEKMMMQSTATRSTTLEMEAETVLSSSSPPHAPSFSGGNPSSCSAGGVAVTLALAAVKDFILPAMGAFIIKTFQLLWAKATQCTEHKKNNDSSLPEQVRNPPLESSSDEEKRTNPTLPTFPQDTSPPSFSALPLTADFFPHLSKCLECFDLFRIILREIKDVESEEEMEGNSHNVGGKGEETEGNTKKVSLGEMYYTVRTQVLQWIGDLGSEAMPFPSSSSFASFFSSSTSSPLVTVAALLPSPPIICTPTPYDARGAPSFTLLYPMMALWHRLLSPLVWLFSSSRSLQSSSLSTSLAFSSPPALTSSNHWRTPSSLSSTEGLGGSSSRSNNSGRGGEREGKGVITEEAKQRRYFVDLEKKVAINVLMKCVERCTTSCQQLAKEAQAASQRRPQEESRKVDPSFTVVRKGHSGTVAKEKTRDKKEEEEQDFLMTVEWLHRLAFLLHSPLILLSHMCYIIVMTQSRSDTTAPVKRDVLPSRSAVRLLFSLCGAGLTLFTAIHHPQLPCPLHLLTSSSALVPPPPSSFSPLQQIMVSLFASPSLAPPTYHQLKVAFVRQMEMVVVGHQENLCPLSLPPSPFSPVEPSLASLPSCHIPAPLIPQDADPSLKMQGWRVDSGRKEHTHDDASSPRPPPGKQLDVEEEKGGKKRVDDAFPISPIKTAFAIYPIHLLERFCLLLRCEQENIRGDVVEGLRQLLPLLSPFDSFTGVLHRASGGGDNSPLRAPSGLSPSPVKLNVYNVLHYHLAVLLIRVLQSSTAVLRSPPLSLLHPELLSFWVFLIRDVPPCMRFCSRNAFGSTSLDPVLQFLALDVVKVCPKATRMDVGSLVLEHCLTVLVSSPCTSFSTKNIAARYFKECVKNLLGLGVSQPRVLCDVIRRCLGLMLTSIRPVTISCYNKLDTSSFRDEHRETAGCPSHPGGGVGGDGPTARSTTDHREEEGNNNGVHISPPPTHSRISSSSAGKEHQREGESSVDGNTSSPGYDYGRNTLPASLHHLKGEFLEYLYRAEEVLTALPSVSWRQVGWSARKPAQRGTPSFSGEGNDRERGGGGASRAISCMYSTDSAIPTHPSSPSHQHDPNNNNNNNNNNGADSLLEVKWRGNSNQEVSFNSISQPSGATPVPMNGWPSSLQRGTHTHTPLPLLHINSLLPLEDEGPFDALSRASLGTSGWRENYQQTLSPPLSSSLLPQPRRHRHVSIEMKSHKRKKRGANSPHRSSSSRHYRSCDNRAPFSSIHRSGGEDERDDGSRYTSPTESAAETDSRKSRGDGCRRRRQSNCTSRGRSPSPLLPPLHQSGYYTLLRNILVDIPIFLFQLDQASSTKASTPAAGHHNEKKSNDNPNNNNNNNHYHNHNAPNEVHCSSSWKDGSSALASPISPDYGDSVCLHCGGKVKRAFTVIHPPIKVAPDISLSILLLLLGEVVFAMHVVFHEVADWGRNLLPSPLVGEGMGLSTISSSFMRPPPPSSALPHIVIRAALNAYLEVAMLSLFSRPQEDEEQEQEEMRIPSSDPEHVSTQKCCMRMCHCSRTHPHCLYDEEGGASDVPKGYPISLVHDVFRSWSRFPRKITEEMAGKVLLTSSSSGPQTADEVIPPHSFPDKSWKNMEHISSQQHSSDIPPHTPPPPSTTTTFAEASSLSLALPHLQAMQTELKAALSCWIRRFMVLRDQFHDKKKEAGAGGGGETHRNSKSDEFVRLCLQEDICEAVVELLPSESQRPVERDVKNYLQWYLASQKERSVVDEYGAKSKQSGAGSIR